MSHVDEVERSLETNLEAELELPLLVSRRSGEAVRIGRNGGRRIARGVRGDDRDDPGHLLRIEDVLHLRDDLAADAAGDWNAARVAQIHVPADRKIQRVTRDVERTIARHAVLV